MRVLLAMVEKDLKRRLRSPLPTILLLLFPLIFSGLIALSFGGSGTQAPKVHLLIQDLDDGLVSQLVVAAFNREEAREYFETEKIPAPASPNPLGTLGAVDGSGDSALLEKTAATAILRLPKDFSADVLAGRPTRIELVKSPAQSILPDVAEQVTTVLAEGLTAASRVLREPLAQIDATPGSPDGVPADPQVAAIAVLTNQAIRGVRKYVFPPVVKLETVSLAASPGKPGQPGQPARPSSPSSRPSLFLLFLPGISVFALFNLADQTMRDLLVEARLKTLRRQLAGPLTAGRVIAGKALSTAAVAALALVVLTGVGALVVQGGVNLVAYLLLSIALLAATTGFASAVFGLANGEKQGATLASLLSLVMAFAGGSFIPLDSLPKALAALSPFSLIYWATQGYRRLLAAGADGAGSAGLREVAPNIAVLAIAGALLLVLSGFLWQRRLLKGDLA